LIRGENYKPRKYVFAEKTNHCLYDPIRCVTTEDHKLILNFENNAEPEVPSDITDGKTYKAMVNSLRNTRQTLELYDLKKDRWEKNNVVSDQEYS
jgi:N-sulfoglucosamine sulfohydrolase